jgi:hypothetical protein
MALHSSLSTHGFMTEGFTESHVFSSRRIHLIQLKWTYHHMTWELHFNITDWKEKARKVKQHSPSLQLPSLLELRGWQFHLHSRRPWPQFWMLWFNWSGVRLGIRTFLVSAGVPYCEAMAENLCFCVFFPWQVLIYRSLILLVQGIVTEAILSLRQQGINWAALFKKSCWHLQSFIPYFFLVHRSSDLVFCSAFLKR